METTAKIGYAKATINPPLGTDLAGHAIKERKAIGIHDDLYCRVLVLELQEEDYCLIQNDLIGLDYEFVDTLKRNLISLGFKDQNIFIGCTHTHSGPRGLSKDGNLSPEYIEMVKGEYDEALINQYLTTMIETTKKAGTNKAFCEIRYGFTEVYDVCCNRNHKEKPGDPWLFALEFLRTDGKKLLLYNYACHPTIVNHGNHYVTADFPYGVANLCEGKEYEQVIFINGSSGDISTRFTRKEASFTEIDRIGDILWGHIKTALSNADAKSIDKISIIDSTYKMLLKKADTVEVAKAKLEKYQKELEVAIKDNLPNRRTYESFVEGAQFGLFRAYSHSGEEYTEVHYKILKLNDLTFVFVPSELFSDLSNPLRIEYGKKLIFCTHFNGSLGYIADSFSYENDTYETQTSNFEKGQGEAFMECIKKQL